MLAARIIPVLLRRGMQLVKGKGFASWRNVGHALQAARIYETRGVDELMILDIGLTIANRAPDAASVAEFTKDCFMPLTVGGGVKHVNQVRDILANGADKVLVGTAAHDTPKLVEEIAHRFGSQAISVAVDVGSTGTVWTRCGTWDTGKDPVEYAQHMEHLGAGEIVLNSIPRDGTMLGYDLPCIDEVSSSVSIPVVAAGGAGTYEHLALALKAGAHAVAAGAMFQFTDATPKGAAQYLAAQGFHVRSAA